METIVQVVSIGLDMQRTQLSCGHSLMLAITRPVGSYYTCQACLYHEPRIVAIVHKDKKINLALSCGHNPAIETDLPHETLEVFIETSHPCKTCREKLDAQ